MSLTDPPPPPYSQVDVIRERMSSESHSPEITSAARRSMEDELRPLPVNWIRQYDPQSGHQFYVNIGKKPARSIWHHPYDDAIYISTLSSSERLHVDEINKGFQSSTHQISSSLPTKSPIQQDETPGRRSSVQNIGHKLKNIITNTTLEERTLVRQERKRVEEQAYRQHQHVRAKMAEAVRTGKSQLIGKDSNGKEVWVQAPASYNDRNGLNGGLFGESSRAAQIGVGLNGMRGYQARNGSLFNPYGNGFTGICDTRYNRPHNMYHRPGGGGYGGGLGIPLALGLSGGILLGGSF